MPRHIKQSRAYQWLAAHAQLWGGAIVEVAKHDWPLLSPRPPDWSEAPFRRTVGVRWEQKQVVHRRTNYTIAALIHEMGHVFALRTPPGHKDTEEPDFLGWELTVARQLGVMRSWQREMSDYGIDLDDHHREIGDLDRRERRQVYATAIIRARDYGSLGPNLEPLTVRT